MWGDRGLAGWFSVGMGALLVAGSVSGVSGVRHGWPMSVADEASTSVVDSWATSLQSMKIAVADTDVASGPVSDDPIIATGRTIADDWGVEADVTSPEAAKSMAGTRIWFERDGEPIVVAQPWTIGDNVAEATLRDGPGHYPSTAIPGSPGNVGIAGHRTTHGAPFWALDELGVGDEVYLQRPSGQRRIYIVVDQAIVEPDEVWVLDDDVLGSGRELVTITTCHPRFSASHRLVVWAELVDDVRVTSATADQRQAS